jgi:hypothetical protein
MRIVAVSALLIILNDPDLGSSFDQKQQKDYTKVGFLNE